MTYKIHSPEALEASADFTLNLDIAHVYPTKNADGSNPSASLKVKAPSISIALQVLSQLNADENEDSLFFYSVLSQAAVNAGVDPQVLEDDSESAELDVIRASVMQQMNDTSTWLDVNLELEVEDYEEPVVIAVRAPSFRIMLDSFNSMTSNKRLSQLAWSFMPDADDDEEDDFLDN